jgi:hypothetical protein
LPAQLLFQRTELDAPRPARGFPRRCPPQLAAEAAAAGGLKSALVAITEPPDIPPMHPWEQPVLDE